MRRLIPQSSPPRSARRAAAAAAAAAAAQQPLPSPPSPSRKPRSAAHADTAAAAAAAAAPAAPSAAAATAQRIELIVKLGGSALTEKQTRHTVHAARFAAAVDTVARLHAAGVGLVVVHGAGSFGHFEAAEARVAAGAASALGVAATHAAVARLNQLVVDALLARGVPAVGVSPLQVPARVRVDFVAALLDRGHLPVVHADACYAGDGRTAILSGDALVASFAAAFELVRRVVFLSDVPGVLRRPPEEMRGGGGVGGGVGGVVSVGGEGVAGGADSADGDGDADAAAERALVRRVTVNSRGEVSLGEEVRTSAATHDVSGGIAGKVAAAARCVAEARGRVVAFIAGVGTESAECALVGRMPEPWDSLKCTRITYEIDAADDARAAAQAASGSAARSRSGSGSGSGGAGGVAGAAVGADGGGDGGGGGGGSSRRRNWFAS